jgi:riboflavin kinase / FMN adenylyltransferase
MTIFTRPGDFVTRGRKVSLAIGMFDGVHLGHQQVIRQAVSDAEQHEGTPIAITFDRHPSATLAPERVPLLIHSQPQKLRALESLGVEATLIIPFTPEFSTQSADSFITSLTEALAPVASICVGSSFVFGHKRSGNVSLLKQLGSQLGFIVHGIAAVSLDGEVVSSTRIREAVRRGDLDGASQMLGREYSLSGPVMRGDGLGRKLGFATANLDVGGLVVPPAGVYAVHAYLGGQRHRAVVNVGFRPTLQNPTPELRVEAHLLGFAGDLYGRELELTFVERLREEQKFPSLGALKTQIQKDIEAARTKF